jgi:hypothetical protein
MAIQIVWERVNLGEDSKGELIIAHRGATLPNDFLDDYKRDALALTGAIKIVPDEALASSTVKAKSTADSVDAANTAAGDGGTVAAQRVAELEAELKAAREQLKVLEESGKDPEKNVRDGGTVAPQASSGPTAPAKPATTSTPTKSAPAKATSPTANKSS